MILLQEFADPTLQDSSDNGTILEAMRSTKGGLLSTAIQAGPVAACCAHLAKSCAILALSGSPENVAPQRVRLVTEEIFRNRKTSRLWGSGISA